MMCGLIDSDENWVGGSKIVVQCGDTLDGKRPGVKLSKNFKDTPEEIPLMKFIQKLDSQATKNGGRVISLLGNHEIYHIYYKNDPEFTKEMLGYVKGADRKHFRDTHGMKRVDHLSPGNKGGIFLAENRPLFYRKGEFLFMHGSLTDSFIKLAPRKNKKIDISAVNTQVKKWLLGGSTPKYLNDANDINPLFNRAMSEHKVLEKTDCDKISNQLSSFNGIKYVVMGHSVHEGINSTCNGTLFRIDVALSRAFGGTIRENAKKIQVLEIIQKTGQDPVVRIITPTGVLPVD